MEVLFPLFILGLSVGSFLNVLIDRLPREEQVFKGRSYCESCRKTIKWYDLIPILSFIILKAKCRYCRLPLSYYYPLVELTTGALFVAISIFVNNNFQFSIFNFQSNPNFQLDKVSALGYYLFIASSLVVIFFVDLKYGIIPDVIIYSAIAVSFLYIILNTYYLIPLVAAAVGSFLFFLIIFLATRGRGMGFGDVKFAFLMGLLLGFPKTIPGLYVAFLTGAVVSIILILIGKKKFRGSTVPFGPFLVIGTLISLFWGDIILQTVFPFL